MPQEPIRILLIDDIRTDINEITEQLGETISFPFDLMHFSDMRDSVTCIQDNTPAIDLIVLDLGLLSHATPKEIFSIIKRAAKAIPIIVITGKEDHELAVFVMNAGAADNMLRGNTRNTYGKLGDAIEFSLARCKILNASRKLTNESEHLRKQLIAYINGEYTYSNAQ